MKKRNLFRICLVVCGLSAMAMFQNCAKVQATDIPTTESKIATASDQQGQDVPVDVQPADDVVNPPAATTTTTTLPTASNPPPAVEVENEDHPPVDVVANCGLDLKTIHNVIDVDQFKEKVVNLKVLQGKTLVYSSGGKSTLESLVIESASGRTILCNVVVDELVSQNGRLDVYHSEIKKIDSASRNIRADSASILPAGF